MAKGKPGRPKKYTPELTAELLEDFDRYIDETEIPIVKEWCVSHKIPSNHVYDLDGFAEPIKRCIDKKEVGIQRAAHAGTIPPAIAIFTLKQLGWKDRQEVTGADGGPLEVIYKVIDASNN